jgi:hypothetical protein
MAMPIKRVFFFFSAIKYRIELAWFAYDTNMNASEEREKKGKRENCMVWRTI